jgi:hypothetical protein
MTRSAAPRVLRHSLFLLLAAILAGCAAQSSSDVPTPDAPESRPATDAAYLTQSLWNDGQAEVAFYRVERTQDQYGRNQPQSFLAGTYLVKQRFDPQRMTKATGGGGVSAFKYALFYEFESGSYQYKRNWVTNVRQDDTAPLKQSFTSFDWCSNLYREMAFAPDGTVSLLKRSDDYGNRSAEIEAAPNAYPPHAIPLLIRALDVSQGAQSFSVLTPEGEQVQATAAAGGRDSVETPAGTKEATRITVAYDRPVPSPIGEESASKETYWRGTGADRLLLKVEAETGRYRMTLAEHLRTPYWQENLWGRLARVETRP